MVLTAWICAGVSEVNLFHRALIGDDSTKVRPKKRAQVVSNLITLLCLINSLALLKAMFQFILKNPNHIGVELSTKDYMSTPTYSSISAYSLR